MAKTLKMICSWCNRYEWIILLFLLVVVIRLPSLFAPHHYGDEEIYFVMGRAWESGGLMYADAFDHKPPLIYIIAGIAKSVFWFRLILMSWMIAHTFIFWKLAKHIFAKRKSLAYLASLLFVLLSSWPMIEGDIANAELFMMMPISLGLLILLTMKEALLKYFLAGIVFGIGLLFKVPVIFDVAAFVIFIFAFEQKTFLKGLQSLFSIKLWLLIAGFILPIILTIVNYQVRGVGEEYIRAALLVNFGYVSSWQTSSFTFNPFASGLFVRGFILIASTLALYWSRKKLGRTMSLVVLWFLFSLFGALLSGRPYPHYLLQPIVPAALLVPFIFVSDRLISWIWIAIVCGIAILTQNTIGFWGYPTIKNYTNFWHYVSGKWPRDTYIASFDGAERNHKIAEYLGERLTKEDQIYIWGNDVAVYNLLDRLPSGGKYMVDFHVRDWRAWDEVIRNLETKSPKYVLVYPNSVEFENLMSLLSQSYIQINTIDGVQIWRLSGE